MLRGTEHHVLNLRGIVRHAPIGPEAARRFTAEFSELFPGRVLIASEDDLFSFEVTSELVNFVASYIIAMASLISGDLDYSQSLFENVRERLGKVVTDLPAIVKIRQRIPEKLAKVYILQTQRLFKEWRRTHEQALLDAVKAYLDKLQKEAPNDYGGHLMRAIWHFLSSRDVASAKREIRKCREEKDSKWRLSEAFLNAYTGDLGNIHLRYKAAFQYECEPTALLQVEEFITFVVDQEPDKVQLHFCLGLINFFGKQDWARANQDLEKFVALATKDEFAVQVKLAKAYIGTIKGELKRDSDDQQHQPD